MEVIFADDTNLFLFHRTIDKLFASLNVEFENISTWFKSNKLSLEVNKTKSLLFYLLLKLKLLPQILPPFLLKRFILKGNM